MYHTYLPSYSVGPDCYKEIPWATRHFGKKAVAIGGKTAMEKAHDALLEGIKGSDVQIVDFIWYGGDATFANAQALLENSVVQGADMVFAIGGGRAVDTCKVVAEKLDKPLFAFPTIASNCASTTAIAVIYDENGNFQQYFYRETPPEHTFINTRIIAQAPEAWMWAGVGDALSKGPEVELAARSSALLSHAPMLGVQCSGACPEPLLEHSYQALADNRAGRDSEPLEEVVLDIIVTTGVVSNLTASPEGEYYYNSSLAHAFYNGSTAVPGSHKHRHGELVAFGVLVLLTAENRLEERAKYGACIHKLGLPVTLEQLDIRKEDLPAIAEKASTTTEWTCVPEPLTKEAFIAAIEGADAYGRTLVK